jgi:hypothetical protein
MVSTAEDPCHGSPQSLWVQAAHQLRSVPTHIVPQAQLPQIALAPGEDVSTGHKGEDVFAATCHLYTLERERGFNEDEARVDFAVDGPTDKYEPFLRGNDCTVRTALHIHN